MSNESKREEGEKREDDARALLEGAPAAAEVYENIKRQIFEQLRAGLSAEEANNPAVIKALKDKVATRVEKAKTRLEGLDEQKVQKVEKESGEQAAEEMVHRLEDSRPDRVAQKVNPARLVQFEEDVAGTAKQKRDERYDKIIEVLSGRLSARAVKVPGVPRVPRVVRVANATKAATSRVREAEEKLKALDKTEVSKVVDEQAAREMAEQLDKSRLGRALAKVWDELGYEKIKIQIFEKLRHMLSKDDFNDAEVMAKVESLIREEMEKSKPLDEAEALEALEAQGEASQLEESGLSRGAAAEVLMQVEQNAAADDDLPIGQEKILVELEKVQAENWAEIEAERIAAERVELERITAERVELERIAAERIKAERVESERIAAEKRVTASRVRANRGVIGSGVALILLTIVVGVIEGDISAPESSLTGLLDAAGIFDIKSLVTTLAAPIVLAAAYIGYVRHEKHAESQIPPAQQDVSQAEEVSPINGVDTQELLNQQGHTPSEVAERKGAKVGAAEADSEQPQQPPKTQSVAGKEEQGLELRTVSPANAVR